MRVRGAVAHFPGPGVEEASLRAGDCLSWDHSAAGRLPVVGLEVVGLGVVEAVAARARSGRRARQRPERGREWEWDWAWHWARAGEVEV